MLNQNCSLVVLIGILVLGLGGGVLAEEGDSISVVILKNGASVRGQILEDISGDKIVIERLDGVVIDISYERISSITSAEDIESYREGDFGRDGRSYGERSGKEDESEIQQEVHGSKLASQDKAKSIYVSFGLGVFTLSDKVADNTYNSFVRPEFTVSYGLGRTFALEFAFAYMETKGNFFLKYASGVGFVEREPKISIMHVDALVKVFFAGESPMFYFGAGLTSVRLKETFDVISSHANASNIPEMGSSFNPIGLVSTLGLNIPINKKRTICLYLESSIRTARTARTGDRVKFDVGGYGFESGFLIGL